MKYRGSTMGLTPGLSSVNDLFQKLKREAHRAYHAENKVDKVDHFYNFCVTAHSMRDYFLEHAEVTEKLAKDRYHSKWNKDKCLLAAKEIANSTKHLRLWHSPETREVRPTTGKFVDIYYHEDQKFSERCVEKPDLTITLKDGPPWKLYQFIQHVSDYWSGMLQTQPMGQRRRPRTATR